MAEETEKLIPLLTPEQVRRLKENKRKLIDAKAALSRLKALGMGTQVIEEKLDWADKVQETLLKDFAKE